MENEDSLLVSVIIPAYNTGDYISETIYSVLNQQHENLELIIVNDGSTDNTEEIVKGFSFDKRVKFISQVNNGCSAAKNAGLQMASGEFIQYLDADDLLSPDKIKEQVGLLKNQRGGIAVCRTISFHHSINESETREIDSDFLYSTGDTFGFILNLYGLNNRIGMIQPNAFLISRQIADRIGPYDRSISPSPDEDGEYFCRVMLAADHIYFEKKGINYYRKRLNSRHSLSNQLSYLHAKGALKSLQLITKHLLARENSEKVRKVMAGFFANFIYLYSKYKDLGIIAEHEISSLGIRKIPSTGGRNFKKISKWVGFHNALRVKNMGSFLKNPGPK